MRQQIIDEMFKIAKTSNAFEMLEEQFGKITKSDLSNQIVEVGIMPELFDHDSSEEKMWSNIQILCWQGP